MQNEDRRDAFLYLRDQARSAHLSGDGLRVNHLAAIALSEFRKLADQGAALVKLEDVKWSFILPHYWLLHDYMLSLVRDGLNKASKLIDEDNPLANALSSYLWLSDQPLIGMEESQKRLANFSFAWCRDDDVVEDGVLIAHAIEIVWWNSRGASGWLEIVDDWIIRAPEIHRGTLKTLRDRLVLQSRLTRPNSHFSQVRTDEMKAMRAGFPLAPLWMLSLHGEAKLLDAEIEALLRSGRVNGTDARVIFDVHHWNRFNGKYGEEQPIGLTRRYVQMAESPVLVFGEFRRSQRDDVLGKLYRQGDEQDASERFDVFRLIKLDQLAALRLWSWGDWINGIRAEAHATFEASRWKSSEPAWAVEAIQLSIIGGNFRRMRETPEVRPALEKLEFAPSSVLVGLVEQLLGTYFQQKPGVWDALLELGDLIPESAWESVARWQTEFLIEDGSKQRFGRPANRLPLWAKLLPSFSKESPIWRLFESDIVEQAALSHSWSYEGKHFFLEWICRAPEAAAIKVADCICAVQTLSLGERSAKAFILGNAELRRAEFVGRYRERLWQEANLWEERLRLQPLLTDAQKLSVENEAKPRIADQTRLFIRLATPDLSARSFHTPHGRESLILAVGWGADDWPLVQDLVEAIESPQVVANCLPYLLVDLAYMLRQGPGMFAERLLSKVQGWAKQPPVGRKISHVEAQGPFVGFSLHTFLAGSASEGMTVELGWLVDAMLKQMGAQASELLREWLQGLLNSEIANNTALAVDICLEHADKLGPEVAATCIQQVRELSARLIALAEASPELRSKLADLLHMIAEAIRELPGGREVPAVWKPLLDSVRFWMPSMANSTSWEVRQRVALLALAFRKAGLHDSNVDKVLLRLSQDNRARVRRAASGVFGHE